MGVAGSRCRVISGLSPLPWQRPQSSLPGEENAAVQLYQTKAHHHHGADAEQQKKRDGPAPRGTDGHLDHPQEQQHHKGAAPRPAQPSELIGRKDQAGARQPLAKHIRGGDQRPPQLVELDVRVTSASPGKQDAPWDATSSSRPALATLWMHDTRDLFCRLAPLKRPAAIERGQSTIHHPAAAAIPNKRCHKHP